MAFHKLTLIGKLVSDPKSFDFNNGGKVAKFGLPVDFTRRKKNPTTGEWEGESFIIDVSAFNRDNYKLADIVLQYLKKGSQVYVEGKLKPNEYTDKNGVKVFKPVLIADVVEFLDPRQDGGGIGMGGGMGSSAPRTTSAPQRQMNNGGGSNFSDEPADETRSSGNNNGGQDEEIPF